MKAHEIEALAQRVLDTYGQKLPVDLSAICSEEKIELAPGDYASTFHGRLEFVPEFGVFIIYHPAFGGRFPTGRIRFSICHELGHYFLDEHRAMIERGQVHNSSSALRSVYNRIEDEADRFAAALLMPAKELEQFGVGSKEISFESILSLATYCRASRQAMAFRYVELANEPCVVVISQGNRILCHRSSDEADARGFRYLGTRHVPDKSTAAKCINAPANAPIGGPTDTSIWFSEREYGNKLWEESIRLGETDFCLTLLSWQ